MEEKKKLLCSLISLVIILSMAVVLLSTVVEASPATEIWDWYDLHAVRYNLDGSYILMNDLDSTTAGYAVLAGPIANGGKGWQPIGYRNWDGQQWTGEGFGGTFDGQGYEIRDLFINRPDENEVGLFGSVDEGGIIKNISVMNADVTGNDGVGGLLGMNWYGTVSDSYSTGSVTGNGKDDEGVGGLLGMNWYGIVTNSYSSGSVTGESFTGGLVGGNLGGTVTNSYSSGNVTGNEDVGGLVGMNMYGTVSDSYSTGSATGNGGVGGLVGANSLGTVRNSYYNYDEVLINSENIITIGALFGADFEEWLANGKFLDVNERLYKEGSYYVINNINDFKQLLAFGQDSSLKFRLKNDLDLATAPNFYIPYLAGEFDGNGHKISNLSFNFDFVSQAEVGLFGYLASDGRVTKVGVENVNISAGYGVGGLVGFNDGTVTNSYSSGSLTGNGIVGGLVGFNDGTVSNSYSSGSVTGDEYVGGLVGYSIMGTVSNSYSSGSVTGDEYVGGLVGYSIMGTVSNSYSSGSVTGDEYVGGLVGYSIMGTVSNSYSSGSVTGDEYVGGLVGRSDYSIVSNSFWDIETSGQTTSAGGTGKTTAEMKDIATFTDTATEGLDEPWNITAVASGETNPAYTWNIVDDESYPFLTIGKTGDVNNDGHVNVLDMILIGQYWGQTGSPGWIPEDVIEDGEINVLDMIIIGQHWTG
jgi:hypothetical protein